MGLLVVSAAAEVVEAVAMICQARPGKMARVHRRSSASRKLSHFWKRCNEGLQLEE